MAATPHPKGTVCIVPDPTETHENRHVLIISDIDRPYVGEEYTVAALTTASPETYSQPVVTVPYSEITEGHLTQTCRAMPWSLHTISTEDIIKTPARVSDAVLARLADAIHEMLTG
jgi:mRNA-degrading endonuclease toxin of MazEF toxin-antitoxin module